ncbi:hypothetical protein ASPCAL11358 [Aspergillus calidoustus]|uniref:Clr5 domain-containing protein n=1 Tax=Aspergillus calidoustus TaxID=454130 RepID=A0A0U5GEI7_ASPCI|nr:hypothetical protein ASPCAL11358 [Aspergillus calidoustus]
MDDSIWESYKPELQQLYIQQNMKLPEVMDFMSTEHGFQASKGQYTKYFSRWKFQKYQTVSSSNSKFIDRRVNKRRQMFGKESEVYINGVEYPTKKVKRARYRKAYLTASAAVDINSDGIVVCTPVSPGMNIHWNNSLPWLRFARLLQPGSIEDLPSPAARLAVTSPQSHNADSYTVIPELLKWLKDVVPWSRLSLAEGINSASRIDTVLRILLPEAQEGQHYALAARICGYKQTTLDTFSITMFLLSNNFPTGDRKSHDQRVLKMLRASGWDSRTKLQELLSSKEPTAGAIMEQLFGSALREFDIDIVSMLLDAGMSPDCLIRGDCSEPSTPLGFLAGHLWDRRATDPIGLLNLLHSHGADIDKSGHRTSPLEEAVRCSDTDTIEWFLSHGAQITRSCIAGKRSGNVGGTKILARADVDSPSWDIRSGS